MLKKPIEIHIYDDNGEVKDTYKLFIIPWKVMKKFVSVIESFGDKLSDANEMEIFNRCDGVLCEAYGNKFDEQTLAEHADSAEVLNALSSIFEAIEGTNPNAVKGLKAKSPKNTTLNGGAGQN